MKPDEIAVLLVVALFIGTIAVAAIHSRRQDKAAEVVGSETGDEGGAALAAAGNADTPQSRERGKKRRR